MAKFFKFLLIPFIFLLFQNFALAEYCLKVNVWRLQDLTSEMRERVSRTVANEKERGQFHEDFSLKHGKELRLMADEVRPGADCLDIKSGKFDDRKGINTGELSRDISLRTVFVSFYPGMFSKEVVLEAETVSGIARFYFDKPYKLKIWFKNKEEFLSPVQGYITLESKEWLGDTVVSVHGLTH